MGISVEGMNYDKERGLDVDNTGSVTHIATNAHPLQVLDGA